MTLLAALALWSSADAQQPGASGESDDGGVSWPRISGSARGGYWSSSRTLDHDDHFGVAAVWLQASAKLSSDASLFVEGWGRDEDLLGRHEPSGKLREAYLDLGLGPATVRLGRQIVAWGRADRINPTDNLTPRDFTLLVPEDADQRLGTAAVSATYTIGDFSVAALWLPEFIPHTIPVEPLEPPISLRKRVPDGPVSQWALKIDRTARGVDWSVSYFDGFDLFPDLGIDRVSPAGVELIFRHHRIRVVGADVATAVGPYALRGEVAYTFTEDPRGRKIDVKNPFWFVVLGGDRTVAADVNVNVQYIFRYIVNFERPNDIADPSQRGVAIQQALINNQLDRVQHAAAIRISRKWLNENLEGEIAAILGFTRLDYAIRPKVTYAITDTWRLTVGGDVFNGPEPSFFRRLHDNTTAFAELRRSF
jgi:hypothetical protein